MPAEYAPAHPASGKGASLCPKPISTASRQEESARQEEHTDESQFPESHLAHWTWVMRNASKQWVADRAMTLGSSLAYYTLFSLAPLLLFAIALAGAVFGNDQARAGIVRGLNDTLGADVAFAIEAILNGARSGGTTTVTLFGLAMLLFGASSAFVELQSALNLIWKVKESQSAGMVAFLRARILSLGAVVGMGFLLLVSLVLSSGLSLAGRFAGGILFWQFVNLVMSLGLITLVFALVYRLLPDVEIAWHEVWGGALAAALLFALGKQIFTLYLSQAGVTSMYGSAASVIVVLLWVYYSSLILLFGAEVAHSHAARLHQHRSKAAPSQRDPISFIPRTP